MIVFFSFSIAPQFISSQCYVKAAFFLSGLLSWNGSNTFQRKITTTKHGCFIYENRQEQLMWQKIIMSSCNKTFKQVLFFLSSSTFFTLIWNSSQVFELIKAFDRKCSVKTMFCLQLYKLSLWHMCFLVNFAKFLRTPLFTENLQWLLLN